MSLSSIQGLCNGWILVDRLLVPTSGEVHDAEEEGEDREEDGGEDEVVGDGVVVSVVTEVEKVEHEVGIGTACRSNK